MKHLLTIALALLCGAAFATGKPPAPSQQQHQTGQVVGNYNGGSDAWAVALPSWGGSYGSDLTVCNSGWGWGAKWGPDMECIELVFKLRALHATPVPKPTHYPMAGTSGFSPSDEAAKADTQHTLCDTPASDKPVRTAAAAGNGNGKPKPQKVAAVAPSVAGCPK
jgi:hypothetical protein